MRNFNPVMATAGNGTVIEVGKIVAVGSLGPDQIHAPSIYVDWVILSTIRAKPEWIAETTALAHRLSWLSNRLTARAVDVYRPLGLNAISARVIRVLGPIPSVRAATLSARIDVDPAATSRALKSLKEQGWVYTDGRRRLALTESGVRLHDEVTALSDEMYRGLTDGFSAADRKQLLAYLLRLRENLPALAMMTSADQPRSRVIR